MQAIYFDMDGTIANLYGVANWESKLNNEDVSPYRDATPFASVEQLNAILNAIAAFGVTIGVISWSAMNGSKEYNKEVRKVKKQWCDERFNCFSEFHVVKYGTPKHYVAKYKDSILVDDNAEVRQAWKNGETIDATEYKNILKELKNILTTLIEEC